MAKMAIRSFEEENKRRTRLRILFLLISAPIVVAIGLFFFKTANMFINANDSVVSYANEDYRDSYNSAQKLKDVNIIEPWLAYYDSGTALAADSSYIEAATDLEEALGLVYAGPNECMIRANLAIVYEEIGDEADAEGNTDLRDAYYEQARLVIENASEGCFPPQSGDGEGTEGGKSMEETDERIEQKQQQGDEGDGNGGNGGDQPSEEGEPASPGDAEEQIEQQMEQSNEDRNNTENQNENNNGQPPVEKPW